MKHQAFHYLQKPLENPRRSFWSCGKRFGSAGCSSISKPISIPRVGRRIRGKRHELDLTLKQLANRTGLSVSLISQIELGKSAASMSTMHKLAAALGVRMTFFFETL